MFYIGIRKKKMKNPAVSVACAKLGLPQRVGRADGRADRSLGEECIYFCRMWIFSTIVVAGGARAGLSPQENIWNSLPEHIEDMTYRR
jgi:hypothetical protein